MSESTGVFGKVAAATGASPPTRPSADRPNILLIMADQLGAQFLPTYGHDVVKAPAISRLADSGAVFESAYCAAPLCAPSRFTMMSGQLGSVIGAYDNASEFASEIPTFAHYLRAAGYRTALSGKMHFVGADQLHGYERRMTTDIYPADFGWTPDWTRDERIDWWYHNMDSVLGAGVAESSNQLDYDDDVAHHGVRALRDLARATDDRPWMLTVSFTHPHDPYVARRDHWDRYEHDAIDMPAVGALDEAELDPHSKRLRKVSNMDAAEITDDHIRNARHAYYASISYIDDQVERLLSTLEATGQADNTMIVFTADHGDMLGEQGLWYKMSFHEAASRVPLIISQPGRFGAGVRIAHHVSLLDLLPTFVDAAATSVPDELAGNLAGESLIPTLDGQRDPNRTVVSEYLGEGAISPMFMVRRGALKYVSSKADPPQLFDLAEDPHELHNVAGSDNWAHLEAEFQAEVASRWDATQIHESVIESQQSRRVVNAAMRTGEFAPWDFEPTFDGANSYMRNHLDLNDVEAGRRLPDARDVGTSDTDDV